MPIFYIVLQYRGTYLTYLLGRGKTLSVFKKSHFKTLGLANAKSFRHFWALGNYISFWRDLKKSLSISPTIPHLLHSNLQSLHIANSYLDSYQTLDTFTIFCNFKHCEVGFKKVWTKNDVYCIFHTRSQYWLEFGVVHFKSILHTKDIGSRRQFLPR